MKINPHKQVNSLFQASLDYINANGYIIICKTCKQEHMLCKCVNYITNISYEPINLK